MVRASGARDDITTRHRLLLQLLVAAAYVCSGKIGLSFAFVQANATAIWPPTGIGVAATMMLGSRIWPALFAGAFVVNVTTAGTVLTSLGIATGNTLEAVVAASLVRRFASGVESFNRPADVFRFAVLAGLVSTAISATIGVTTLALAGFAAWSAYGPIWLTWWLGDVAGALVIAPLLVLCIRPPTPSPLRQRPAEAGLLAATVVAVTGVVFGGMLPAAVEHRPIAFVVVPVLVWAALRFGPREAAATLLLFAGIAVAGTLRGNGPFAVAPTNESLLLLQAFIATMAVMVLVVAAVVWQRQRAQRELQRSSTRAHALAETSRLLGGSLDYAVALSQLTRALVPDVADWCVVYLVRRDGSIRRITPHYDDPDKQAVMDALARIAPRANWQTDSRPLAAAIKTGRSVLVRQVTDEWLAQTVGDDRDRRSIVERMRARSLMMIPLVARGATLGAMTFTSSEPGRHYTEDDVAFAEDVAGRVALAVDNARLFRKVQQAGADAEQESQAKDEFLAMLAHELRTPLAAITAASAVLDSAGAREPMRQRAREAIRRQAEHLARLTDDLLDVARLTRGTIELTREPVNVAETVDRCVGMLGTVGRFSGHRLQLAVDPVWVRGDVARLDQIVCNLLENAVKYTPAGGMITVRVTGDGDTAVLEVRDTGIGIAADLLPHVFDMFRQGQRGMDRRQGGLGIGLTLVRRLVELHGGSVNADSAGPDRGSVFVVRMPRIPAPTETTPAAATAARAPVRRRRVLIVEDNADARDMLRHALEAGGQDVADAADGLAAIRAAQEFHPDVALIDIGLPDIDGFEVARALRAARPHPDLRLIAVTGYGQPHDRQRALAAGFDDHMVKPVQVDRLVEIITSDSPGRLGEGTSSGTPAVC